MRMNGDVELLKNQKDVILSEIKTLKNRKLVIMDLIKEISKQSEMDKEIMDEDDARLSDIETFKKYVLDKLNRFLTEIYDHLFVSDTISEKREVNSAEIIEKIERFRYDILTYKKSQKQIDRMDIDDPFIHRFNRLFKEK